MSSICAGIKDKNRERLPTCDTTFGVQGNVHHYIGLAWLAPGEKLGFLQMYTYDSEHEAANCTISQLGVQLDGDLIALLQEELDGFNAHVQMLRTFNISEREPRSQIVLFSDTGGDCL